MLDGEIIICLLTPVLGAQQAFGDIGNIQCSLAVEDVDTTVFFLNSPTMRASTEETDHASHSLNLFFSLGRRRQSAFDCCSYIWMHGC